MTLMSPIILKLISSFLKRNNFCVVVVKLDLKFSHLAISLIDFFIYDLGLNAIFTFFFYDVVEFIFLSQ